MPLYTIEQKQRFPASKEAVWDFISSPLNLKIITPPYLDFEVTSRNLPEKIHNGMLIKYRVSPILGIKLNWITEITEVKEPDFFIDEQQKGPYSHWFHKHILKEIPGGVLMTDIINYKPPLAFVGALANSIIVRSKLKGILEFRRKKLKEIFGAL